MKTHRTSQTISGKTLIIFSLLACASATASSLSTDDQAVHVRLPNYVRLMLTIDPNYIHSSRPNNQDIKQILSTVPRNKEAIQCPVYNFDENENSSNQRKTVAIQASIVKSAVLPPNFTIEHTSSFPELRKFALDKIARIPFGSNPKIESSVFRGHLQDMSAIFFSHQKEDHEFGVLKLPKINKVVEWTMSGIGPYVFREYSLVDYIEENRCACDSE